MWEGTCSLARIPFPNFECVLATNAGHGGDNFTVIVTWAGASDLTRVGLLSQVLGDGSIPATSDGDGPGDDQWTFIFDDQVLTNITLPAGMMNFTSPFPANCKQTITLGD